MPASPPAPAGQTTPLCTSARSPYISGGGEGERAPYLEIALTCEDSMTRWLMSKELILSAYSLSSFLLR